MKDSTYNKISNLAAKMRRIEPKWYIGWAVFCLAVAAIGGGWNAVTVGVMYLFMAGLAQERNDAERERDEWQDLTFKWQEQSGAWRSLSDAWQKAYYTEPRPEELP